MSRWMTPLAWHCSATRRMSPISTATVSSLYRPSLEIFSYRLPPLHSSITMYTWFLDSNVS